MIKIRQSRNANQTLTIIETENYDIIDIDEKSEDSDTAIRNFFIRRLKNQTTAQDLRIAFAKIMHKSNASNALTVFRTKSRLKILKSSRERSKSDLKISKNKLEKLKDLFDLCLK